MINIQFKKATMHNFLCFEHSEVLLDSLGYTIVSGKNNRTIDNAVSNGSGKSSVFNAISFALTGETIQGLSKNLENIYADPNDCWVELEFNINNDQFLIKRIKTPKQDLKIYINGIDKSGKGIKESNQILTKYLPDLTSMLLGSVIILGQGLPCKFTEGHPGLRKEKLEKLTKSDYMIQSVRVKLDARKTELAGQLRNHEDLKVSLKTQLTMSQQQLESAINDLKDFDVYAVNGSLELSLSTLNENIIRLEAEKQDKINELQKINDLIKELDEGYSVKLAEAKAQQEVDLLVPTQDLENETKNSIALKAEIKSESTRLKKLDAVTDICPTCGQKLLNVTKIDTSADWLLLHEKESVLSETNQKVTELAKLIKKLNKGFTDAQTNLKSLYNNQLIEYKKQSDHFNTKLKSIETAIQETSKEQVKLLTLSKNYDKLVKNKKKLEKTIVDLEKQLKSIESAIVIDNEHIQVITNLISLAKREFRGILLENVINYINQRVRFYSKEVFDSDALSFSLNENYIDIIYDGKYYEALSGGEKQKVDIIIQLALRDLLSSQLGITSNILVIDEIFDFLDTKGCQKILGVITNLSNIESVFIISHHINDLSISYDSELIVEKGEDGISHIVAH